MRSSSPKKAEFKICLRFALAIKSVGFFVLGASNGCGIAALFVRGFRLHSLPLRFILR
jgi:hypothetical protein